MKTLARLVALPLLLALALAAPAVTQTPVPPQTMPVSSSTQVIGTIVNRTEGGAAPDRLDLVLHAWDADLNERLMLDGQSSPAGTFRFEDVPVEPGLRYSVMATYEGVSYFSEPVRAIEGENLPPFEVPIYETTTGTSQIQIERMHVMFLASHAGLEVAEVYSLSNLGDRAVKAAVSLADGTPATFEFPLPTGATNVTFYPHGSNRFVRTPGGFADTGSLLPGVGSGQIMVNYVLPYTPGMAHAHTAQFATRGVNFLVAEDSGLTVTGDGLTQASAQQTSDGLKFAVLTRGPLQPGESVRVTLSGELTPTVATQADSQASGAVESRLPDNVIVFGGLVIGLALIATGLWRFRQTGRSIAIASTESDCEAVLTQIALLDEVRERGEVDEGMHRTRRAALFEQAKCLIEREEQPDAQRRAVRVDR